MNLDFKNKLIKLNYKVGSDIKYIFLLIILSTEFLYLGSLLPITSAEQAGSSPDTGGAQSIMVKTYNTLVSKGSTYGSSSSPDWTYDWGTYWNRIMYSASWEPDGTATTSDVLSDKTFYSSLNNRTIKTGTASYFDIDYSQESLIEYDDYESGDYEGEESTWTNTNALSGSEVWYDTRTGLYWSNDIGDYSNSFSSPSTGYCGFFETGSYPTRGDYGTSGTDPDCGNAINACATLSLASTQGELNDTDWYFPSRKELLRAYLDGMYNQAGPTFTTTSYFWSSTENSASSGSAWRVKLNYGYTVSGTKTTSYAVRCVRRD